MSIARPHFKLSYQVKRTFLHHLRHLLRECSYLPDPAARKYFHNHILDRFRDYRPRDRSDVFWNPQQKWILDERDQVRCLHECRKKTSFLYRAGMGDETALTRVLYNTYGRTGKRRHELLKPYLQPDIPKDPTELQLPCAKVESSMLELPKALKLLGQTQTQHTEMKAARVIHRFKKYTEPVLPPTNIWGRNMPQKRIANAKRRRYNDLLERLLPPIPQDEWDRLRSLAMGQISYSGPLARRIRLPGLPELPHVEDRHILTRRFMRRLWAKVFLQCPTMSYDAVKGQWSIVWGKLVAIRTESLNPTDEERYLFNAQDN